MNPYVFDPVVERMRSIRINIKEPAMNLEVITGTPEEFESAVPFPEEAAVRDDFKKFVKEQLAAAEAAGEDLVCFRSLPPADKPSDTFDRCLWIEQAIQEFQLQHAKPSAVRIVSDSDKTGEPFKVIYNFYYAVTKDDRLEDESWD